LSPAGAAPGVSERPEVVVVRSEPNRLTLRIRGEDHTLLNLLVEELNRDSSVAFAAYRQEHPLTGEYTLTIVTDGTKTPLQALVEAAGRAREVFESILEQWRKAVGGG